MASPSVPEPGRPQRSVSRRAAIAGTCGAGVTVAVAGCSTYGGTSDDQAAPPVAAPSPAGEAPGGAAAPAAAALAKVADIPVGGGRILDAQKVVLTHPEQGTIKAFSTTCTHAGCAVNEVSGGTINCPCHGSRFRIADGSVAGGPASGPLPAVPVRVTGDSVTLA